MSALVYSPWKKAEERVGRSLHKLSDLLVYDREHLYELEKFRVIEWGLRQLQLMLRNVEAVEGLVADDDTTLKLFAVDVKLLASYVEAIVAASRSSNTKPSGWRACIKTSVAIFKGHTALYKLIHDIEYVKSSIYDLMYRGSALGLKPVEARNDLSLVCQNCQLQEQSLFADDIKEGEAVGLEEDVHVLISWLIDGQGSCKVISIVGAGGMGKTTLAMKVYKNAVIQRHFHCRAWVTLPENFEIVQILHIIAKQVIVGYGNFDRDWTTEELREIIIRSLHCGRYLIVLDNVTTYKAWDALQGVFPDASNSSRILVTTRDRAIALSTQSVPNLHSIFDKRALSDEKSWELFTAKLIVPAEVEKLGRAIVKKCNGLPRTISAAGEFLSRKPATQEHWSQVLEQIAEDEALSYYAFNLAADALPSYLKLCLSYFGLFPEDYNIPARKLILLWLAEGLVQQIDGRTAPEDIAEKYLRELENYNMIQVGKRNPDGKIKTCRMHYLLRGQWVPKAKEAIFVHSRSNLLCPRSRSSKGAIRRLADNLDMTDDSFSQIHGNNAVSHSSHSRYRDLRSFLSFDYREGPVPGQEIGNFLHRGIILQCFRQLRAIDLEGVFRPQLPKEIAKLDELRYLGLRRTYVEMLPSSIGYLQKLQILDLKHTYIDMIPSSLWKMLHLRHLYLNDSYRGRFVAAPCASSLTELQTLWGAFIDEESLVKGGLDRFINLRKLSLVCQLTRSQQMELAKWLPKLSHLQSLRLRSIDEFVQPSNLYLRALSGLKNLSNLYLFGRLENQAVMHHLPEKLSEVTLSVSRLTEDPMPKLEKLPNLRILRLLCCSYTGKTMICSTGGFPFLRVLKLWKLEELEEWVVERRAMTIVSEIEIRSCNKLKTVPEGIQHLKHCRELRLKNMSEEFRARVVSRDWSKIAHVPSIHLED